MVLEQNDIKSIIDEGHDKSLSSLLLYQSILRTFTENKTEPELREESGFKEFLSRFDITDEKKKSRLIESMVYPLKSVDLTQSAGKEINKIWEAKNRFFAVEPNTKDSELIQSEIYNFIKHHTERVFTNAPCSIVVFDLEDEDFNLVNLEDVISYKAKKDELKYIYYHCRKRGCKVLRDGTTQYVIDEKNNIIETITSNTEFNPARFFVTEKVNSSNSKRYSIFSNNINELSDFNFFGVCLTYTESYGAFPVIQSPESACQDDSCNNGLIAYTPENSEETLYKPCQACGGGNLILPGTNVQIPSGLDTDQQSPADVFKFIDPSVTGLNYVKDRQEERRNNIYFSSVGLTSVVTREAVNENQVQAGFESRKSILIGIKTQLESLYKWMVKTNIMFLSGIDVKVEANFGTEFYLYTEEDLQNLMIQSNEAGVPENEKESIYKQLVDTKYKGNNTKIERAWVLNQVNPFPFDNIDSIDKKVGWGTINKRDLFIWTNFTNLIKKFERDNGNVINYIDRIQVIIDKLTLYYEESISKDEQPETGRE